MTNKIIVADFETSVYQGQRDTEVWASACVELYTEDVHIFNSIDDTYSYFSSLMSNLTVYYHNLKFDGNFWLSYFFTHGFDHAAYIETEEYKDTKFIDDKYMKAKQFKYLISDMGQWYCITVKTEYGYTIKILDSLKLLPFSVKEIGNSFATKHKKLDMKYSGERHAGGIITDEEKKYIANDVLVVKEALEFMFANGHNKMTIGACCLKEYKRLWNNLTYADLFPNLYEREIDADKYGSPNMGEYIRKAYKGGWCYVVEEKAGKLKKKGFTADVNSLYPSMMHSESGNRYPVGYGVMYNGLLFDQYKNDDSIYYFVRLKTRFYIKENKLPFIQIKNSFNYKGTEMLKSSDIYSTKTKKYYKKKKDFDGNIVPASVLLTLTKTDYELFVENYELKDTEILDFCIFETEIGIFDEYIDKYKQIKMSSKGAMRQLAKLFLNNLYGKMATSTNSSYKVAKMKDDGVIGFFTIMENSKKPGYIPVGAAITSYARNFTIRAAQANYYGPDKPGFIYADTDSIHCDLPPEKVKGIKVDPVNFCCWKMESYWDEAVFIRQKTYAEHITHNDGIPIKEPYWDLKCAGLQPRCKNYFMRSCKGVTEHEAELFELGRTINDSEFAQIKASNQYTNEELKDIEDGMNMSEDVLNFIKTKRTIKDFNIGLTIPGKLVPKRIKGGVLLSETTYEMR